jgi:hypothetical protein
MSKKVITCIKEPMSNKYFPAPYVIGEKVIYLGEVEPTPNGTNSPELCKQFIRIKRLKPLEERVEFRRDFSPT